MNTNPAKYSSMVKNCVGVVDDNPAIRDVLRLMLESLSMEVHTYASAREYLDDVHGRNCCTVLILDVRLPDISGLQLQRQLLKLARAPAIVFITGHGDIPMAVEAMQNGAIDFLQKPFKEQHLLDSVQKALAVERRVGDAQDMGESVKARLACLTSRERDVLARLRRGLRTKDVALELGISVRTAEEHRANLMKKMHASSVADLLQMCDAIP